MKTTMSPVYMWWRLTLTHVPGCLRPQSREQPSHQETAKSIIVSQDNLSISISCLFLHSLHARHSSAMGGLTYATYGAGMASVVVGLCTRPPHQKEHGYDEELTRMDRYAVQWRGRSVQCTNTRVTKRSFLDTTF